MISSVISKLLSISSGSSHIPLTRAMSCSSAASMHTSASALSPDRKAIHSPSHLRFDDIVSLFLPGYLKPCSFFQLPFRAFSFKIRLALVAPCEIIISMHGFYYRVPRILEVFCVMRVKRLAAKDLSARRAQAQVLLLIACFTFSSVRLFKQLLFREAFKRSLTFMVFNDDLPVDTIISGSYFERSIPVLHYNVHDLFIGDFCKLFFFDV